MKPDVGGFRLIRTVTLILVVIALYSSALMAQIPPYRPTPVVTATPTQNPPPPPPTVTPTPEPTVAAPSTTPAPEPASGEAALEASPGEDGASVQPEEESDETPKSEKVTNPGEVAFTDYQPFDLDEIEEESVKNKWGRFVAGVRGISRYSLFDGKLKFRIGGRAQVDGTAGSSDDKFEEFYLPIENDFSVRRFEVFAAGRLNKFNFNVAFEFGPDWGLSDAWIEGSEGGLEVWGKYLGKLRVGFMGEPFSLGRQTSSYNTGFLERSLPVQTIAPGSNIGAMVHDSGTKGRFTWAAGLFSFGQSNDNNASTSALSLTGRFTFLPVYRDEGHDLVHVGVSLSSRSPSGGDVRYRSRPEARFVDYLVDTGTIEASHLSMWGVEFATVRGPLWVAAEFIQSRVSAQISGDPNFKGSYVQVGWFLTGENRPYRTNSGTFDRLRPNSKYGGGNPFKKKSGGAVELVGRLSNIDLDDGEIQGGQMTDFSAALNWYMNATTRVELNYIHASPRNQGAANIFLLRVQYQPW